VSGILEYHTFLPIFFSGSIFYIVIGDKALVDNFSGAITAYGIFLF
jgi:hypothetical protein